MKIINYCCLAVSCFVLVAGFFYMSSVFSVEGMVEEWKPKELTDITSKEEADNFEKEKKDELNKAQEEEKKAKTDQEKKQAALEIDRVKYDLKTVDMAKIANNWGDEKLTLEQVTQNFQSVKLDREAIDTRIQAYSTDLNVAYEKPLVKVDNPDKYATYYQDMKNVIDQQLGYDEKINSLNSFDVAAREIKDYSQQRNALAQLHDIVTGELKIIGSLYGEGLQSLATRVEDRIAQIDDFFKPENVAQRQNLANQTAGNEVATRLKLNEKIPDDQIATVRNEFATNTSLQHDAVQLEQLLGSMKAYGLDMESGFVAVVKSSIEALKPKIKLEEPSPKVAAVVQELQPEGYISWLARGAKGAFDVLYSGAAVAVDALSALGSNAVGEMGSGIKAAVIAVPDKLNETFQNLGKAGEQITKYSKAAGLFADKMEKAPEMVDQTLQKCIDINEKLDTAGGVIGMIPGERAQEIVKNIENTQNFLGNVIANEARVKNFAEIVKKSSSYVKTVAGIGEAVGTFIVDHSRIEKVAPEGLQEQKKVLSELDRAKANIALARQEILSQPRLSKYQEIAQSIKDAIKQMGDWFKETLFKSYDQRLKIAETNYNTAQKDYLAFIDFSEAQIAEKPNADAIKLKLQAKVNGLSLDKDKNIFQQKAQAFAQATVDLSNVHKEFIDQLDGAYTNFEFMIKALDPYIDMAKASDRMGTLVNYVFDSRDMKLAALNSARSEVAKLKDEVSYVTKGTDFQDVSEVFLDSLSRMVSGQMLETINDYEIVARELEKDIVDDKNALEAYIKQQSPSDMPPGGE